jgi:hypothetical protein
MKVRYSGDLNLCQNRYESLRYRVRYRTNRTPKFGHIVRDLNPFTMFTSYISEIRFNIIFIHNSRYLKRLPYSDFPTTHILYSVSEISLCTCWKDDAVWSGSRGEGMYSTGSYIRCWKEPRQACDRGHVYHLECLLYGTGLLPAPCRCTGTFRSPCIVMYLYLCIVHEPQIHMHEM